MRILVHGLAGDKLGGIETFILNMEKFMPDDMIFDYVLETTPEENKYVHGKGDINYIAPKHGMFANLKDWNRLLKTKKGVDEAVYFNMYSLAWLLPAMLCRLHGYRVIIHAHNNQLHDCGFAQKTLHNINRQIQKWMKITRLTNSELSAKFFFDNKAATMIYNAIDTERFAFNQNKRDEMRKMLGMEEKNVYGFSGRLAYQKNPLFLMEIFAEIAKRDKDAAFLVCGDGDLADETRRKADELGIVVYFAGAVQNIEDYYQAMDCFVLPSRFEGLGIVLVEAQCCGLPCVASEKVIPQMVKMTDLIKFIKLTENQSVWANEIVVKIHQQYNRANYLKILSEGNFNISKGALTLVNVLKN